MKSLIRICAAALLLAGARTIIPADYPPPTEGDYTIRDFRFASGETLPELRIHYRTLGKIDMVLAQYRLLTDGLGVSHARLVMGTSMGGMHTWLWGESHPEFMDALMPLASLPTQISGRNRAWRRIIIDAIRNDPSWNGCEY